VRLLLDTHILLWAALDSERLSDKARTLLENENNALLFSAVSIWEIAIKHARGSADFVLDPELFRRSLLGNGYQELAITPDHAIATGRLPSIHKDPFDRMLVAQSLAEGINLVTADPILAQYPAPIITV
jgi:PIN domain nuclease of toxin-antitoxin system